MRNFLLKPSTLYPRNYTAQSIALIKKKPYNEGWIYEVKGQLDSKCVDAEGYAAILNQTIDKMLEQQQAEKDKEIE